MEGSEEVEPLLVNGDVKPLRELQDMTKSQIITFKAQSSPLSVAWENVNYYVQAKKEKLHILKGCTGVVNPGFQQRDFFFLNQNVSLRKGEMLAIIGGSGAGKSTLLDILARRKTMGEILGKG